MQALRDNLMPRQHEISIAPDAARMQGAVDGLHGGCRL